MDGGELAGQAETAEEILSSNYKAELWSLKDFVSAWADNQHMETWDDFCAAMQTSCLTKTGTIVPPLKLEARLRTCSRHLRNTYKVNPPNYPARPTKPKAQTLQDVVDDLGAALGLTPIIDEEVQK